MRKLGILVPAALVAAACSHELTGPAPSPSAATPPLACPDQLTAVLKLSGSGFSPLVTKGLEGQPVLVLPQVTLHRTKSIEGMDEKDTVVLPDGQADPAQAHVKWTSQQDLELTLSPDLKLPPGLWDATVKNATGSEATAAGIILTVPPPTVTALVPKLLCGEKGGTLEVQGDYFVQVGDQLPKVAVGTLVLDAKQAGQCRVLPGSSGAKACRSLTVELPPNATVPGLPKVVVTNPNPAGCVSTETVQMTIVPPPQLSKAEPDALCSAKGGHVTFTGRDILRIDGALPQVKVGSTLVRATKVDGCEPVNGPSGAEKCTTVEADLPPEALNVGSDALFVVNPEPASCTSHETVTLAAIAPPAILQVTPLALCTAAGGRVAIDGSNFVRIGEQLPAITIGGQALANPSVDGCEQAPGSTTAEICNHLAVDVPSNALTEGSLAVTITNPAPVDCATDPAGTLEMVGPPTITQISPPKLCQGGGTLTVTGTNFRPGSIVSLAGTDAATTTVTSVTSVTATFGPQETGGPFDLGLRTPESCDATKLAAVSVIPGPQVFFVDPPVIYNGIAIQLTAYGSGLQDGLQAVELVGPGGVTKSLVPTVDPAHPTRLQLALPAGIAVGDWDLHVQDPNGCASTLAHALKVVADPTMVVSQVSPAFGWTGEETGITVFLNPTPVPFVGLPRLYLTAHAATSPQGAPLASVTVLASDRATAVVPKGLAPGQYDLVVVNPDGTIGTKASAFVVTRNPAPRIDSLAPGSVPNSATQQFRILGANFRQPLVSLSCTVPGGSPQSASATVVSSATDSVVASFNAGAFTGGAACVVRVTDGDENSYADFSALVITNPSQNLSTPAPGPNLVNARRGLGLASARINAASRYLFAVGGDGGTEASATNTVESTPLDILGTQSGWSVQRNPLQQKRTYVGVASLGRFVYAVGGSDGTSAVASVERAALLDPAVRPEVTDLDLAIATSGLGAGVWYYQVAAVLDGTDAFNPNGETLPSERFPLSLPALPGGKLAKLTVSWSAVPHAAKYRIYRSPSANAPAGAEVLVSEVSASDPLRLVDDGLAPGTATPLPQGSLGTWNPVVSLHTARKGAGVVFGKDPTMAGTWHLYAIAGADGSGTPLRTYEHLTVTVATDGSQTVGSSWLDGTQQLFVGRWQLSAVAGTSDTSSRIAAGTTLVWAGAGMGQLTAVSNVDAASVTTGGELSAFKSVQQMGNRNGYGFALAGNFLYAFSGSSATDTSAEQGEMCASGLGGCTTTPQPPDLRNWNNAAITLTAPRQLSGAVLEGANVYLVGGTAAGGATRTTEQVIW